MVGRVDRLGQGRSVIDRDEWLCRLADGWAVTGVLNTVETERAESRGAGSVVILGEHGHQWIDVARLWDEVVSNPNWWPERSAA